MSTFNRILGKYRRFANRRYKTPLSSTYFFVTLGTIDNMKSVVDYIYLFLTMSHVFVFEYVVIGWYLSSESEYSDRRALQVDSTMLVNDISP